MSLYPLRANGMHDKEWVSLNFFVLAKTPGQLEQSYLMKELPGVSPSLTSSCIMEL